MKIRVMFFLIVLASTSTAYAGRVFGNLKEGNRGVAAEVTITCEGRRPYKGSTSSDADGNYSIFVDAKGRCELVVEYQGSKTPPYKIFSSADPTRYDFELIPDEKWGWRLKRR